MSRSVAWFVTPHGFGHAARSAAVMEALRRLDQTIVFDIFTAVPEFFFRDSLPAASYRLHYEAVDIGLVQSSSLEADLPETMRRLDEFLPFDGERLERLAERLAACSCDLAVCDIAPIGLRAAQLAGVRSVLVENFTWDWIYGEYEAGRPRLTAHIDYLKEAFESAVYHIRTEPAHPRGKPNIITPPVSRSPRNLPPETRKRLGVAETERLIMITLGGIPSSLHFLDDLHRFHRRYVEQTGVSARFLVPGGDGFFFDDAVIRLPYDSGFYHPDLIAAASAIVGKPGYGTLGEIYHAGVPFAYISRPDFRESAVMEAFIERHMPGTRLTPDEFRDGRWLDCLPALLEMAPAEARQPNGALSAARFIGDILANGGNGSKKNEWTGEKV